MSEEEVERWTKYHTPGVHCLWCNAVPHFDPARERVCTQVLLAREVKRLREERDKAEAALAAEREHGDRLAEAFGALVKAARNYMVYHTQKFYEELTPPTGLWPAITVAERHIAKHDARRKGE